MSNKTFPSTSVVSFQVPYLLQQSLQILRVALPFLLCGLVKLTDQATWMVSGVRQLDSVDSASGRSGGLKLQPESTPSTPSAVRLEDCRLSTGTDEQLLQLLGRKKHHAVLKTIHSSPNLSISKQVGLEHLKTAIG